MCKAGHLLAVMGVAQKFFLGIHQPAVLDGVSVTTRNLLTSFLFR
jgi:hypothetical protein